MKLKATKKWEIKTGKNKGLYLAVPKATYKIKTFSPTWGILSDEHYYSLYIRHNVNPDTHYIITHSIWSRHMIRPLWERVIIN